MKKLILFLGICLIAVSFNSCNNDDDDTYSDEIIGKWRLNELIIKIDDESIDDFLTECDKKSTIEFFENGTYISNSFEFNDDENVCIPIETVTGTWENLGNNTYEISDIEIPGLTFSFEFKVTFINNKMSFEFSGTIVEDEEEIDILIKMIFINNDDFILDNIIGKWQLNQEFYDGEEKVLSECSKKMTIQFFEDGIYEERDYSDETLECIALAIKNGSWKNIGNNLYEISNIDLPEVKVTFEDNNNKMNVEFSEIVDGVSHTGKLIFIKVTTT